MSNVLAMIQGLSQKVKGDDYQECRTLQMDLPTPRPVDIEFSNITLKIASGFKTKKVKTILNGVSGVFKSGQVTAIMGPSGAGKSSLLNALTGFSTYGLSGTIRAGDSVCEFGTKQNSIRSLKVYRKKTCYIMQDDRLNPLFTVGEIMKFAADMKLGTTLTEKMKRIVIMEVLNTLGISNIENVRCSNISGGQRRRLSIALELIDNPPVVFLDEPTTGLDSLTSMQCIELLQKLARSGRTIVCSIHQPSASIYSMFDQVYVLAQGVCVYNGDSENTVPYLASVGFRCPKYHNPADFMLEIVNGEYGNFTDKLSIAREQQDWTKKNILPQQTQGEKITSCFSCGKTTIAITTPDEIYKFKVLIKRCLIQQYRDWTVSHLKVLMHIVIGVLLGLFFQKAGCDGSKTLSNIGYLIISCAYLCYTSLMPGVLRFPAELSVLKKENFNNWYNLSTYYMAVIFTGIPMQIWYSIVYSAPSYFLTGQPLEFSRFAMFVLVLAQLTLIADSLGNVIGASVNPVNGTFFGAVLTCAMIVFSGYLVLLAHMNPVMRAISHFSFIKYSFEGLVLAMYSYNRPPMYCPDSKPYCELRYPKEVMQVFSFQHDNYSTDILVLTVGIVVTRVVAYLTLKRYVKRSS